MHNQPREPQPYEDCQAKSIQEFGWTSQGMDWGWGQASRAPHTDVSRNLAKVVVRGILPGLRRRRTGLLPSGPKSSFQMRASFVFHLETKVLESGGRVEKLSGKFPQSVMIWGAMSSAGVGPLCFFLNQRLCTRLTRNLSTSCFLLLTSFLKMLISFFQQDLAPAHPAKSTKSWLNEHELHREYMGYCQEENEKQETKKCRWAEGHCQRNLGFTPPQQCKYQVLSTYAVNEDTFQKANNSLKKFFYWSYEAFYFFEIVNWWVFVKCEPKSSQLKEPKT